MQKNTDEQRQYKRFLVKQKTSFVVNPAWPQMGEMLDISPGGFSVVYQAEEPWPVGDGLLHMIFGANDSCLSEIPVAMVADRTVPGSGEVKRRRCFKFGRITDQQRFLIDCFIWINGVTEC